MEDNLSHSTKLQASVAEIVAIGLVIILVSWFLIKPKLNQLSKVKASIRTQQIAFDQVEADSATLTKLINQLQQSKSTVALIDEALPLVSRVTRLNVLLDGLATASGTKISSLNVQVGDKIAAGNKSQLASQYGGNRKLQTFVGDMTVLGTIDQFKNLLQLIETNGRIVDITNVDLSSTGDNNSFRIKLKAYSYAE